VLHDKQGWENRTALLVGDLDGDGVPEIVSTSWPTVKVGVLKLQGDKYEPTVGVEILCYDCPC
jgi:hypothetical protein